MFVFGTNIKQIAPRNAIRTVVKNVQTIPAPDQHQFAELVSMFSKHILRIAICHRHRLPDAGEEVGFTKN